MTKAMIFNQMVDLTACLPTLKSSSTFMLFNSSGTTGQILILSPFFSPGDKFSPLHSYIPACSEAHSGWMNRSYDWGYRNLDSSSKSFTGSGADNTEQQDSWEAALDLHIRIYLFIYSLTHSHFPVRWFLFPFPLEYESYTVIHSKHMHCVFPFIH